MTARQRRFAICIRNSGAEDLQPRKIYRVLQDKDADKTGHIRVIDDSGEDYLYPARYFVFVDLPNEVQHIWKPTDGKAKRRGGASARGASAPARSR